MPKASTSTLRVTLTQLTSELLSLGVVAFAYPVDSIHLLPPSTLKSCIEWARGTIKHIKSA